MATQNKQNAKQPLMYVRWAGNSRRAFFIYTMNIEAIAKEAYETTAGNYRGRPWEVISEDAREEYRAICRLSIQRGQEQLNRVAGKNLGDDDLADIPMGLSCARVEGACESCQ